ncbi:hypothetical protein BaRGS_00036771, partial [Batillaria attramentaria]
MALWIVYFTLIASGHFVSGQSSVTSGDTASETVRTSVPGGSSVGAGGYNVRSPTGVRSAVPGLSSLTQLASKSVPITWGHFFRPSVLRLALCSDLFWAWVAYNSDSLVSAGLVQGWPEYADIPDFEISTTYGISIDQCRFPCLASFTFNCNRVKDSPGVLGRSEVSTCWAKSIKNIWIQHFKFQSDSKSAKDRSNAASSSDEGSSTQTAPTEFTHETSTHTHQITLRQNATFTLRQNATFILRQNVTFIFRQNVTFTLRQNASVILCTGPGPAVAEGGSAVAANRAETDKICPGQNWRHGRVQSLRGTNGGTLSRRRPEQQKDGRSLSRPTDRQLSPASGTVQSRARNPQADRDKYPTGSSHRTSRKRGSNPTAASTSCATAAAHNPAGRFSYASDSAIRSATQPATTCSTASCGIQPKPAGVCSRCTAHKSSPNARYHIHITYHCPTQPSAVKPAPTPLVTVMPTNPLPPSQPVPTFQPTTSTPSALTTQTSQPQPQPATNFLNELPPSLGLSPDEVMARMPPNVAQNETLRALFFEMITRARLKAMEARQQSQVSNTDRMTTQPQTPVISTTPSPVISSTNPQANPTTEPPPQAPVVESPANAAAPSPFVILLPKESGGVASSINIDTLKALLGGGAPSLPSTLQAAATETPQVAQTTQPPATTMIPGTTPQQIITTVTTTPLPPTTTFLGIVLEPAITFSLSLPESSIHNIRSPSMHTLLQPMISATIGKAETAKSKIEQFKTALYDTLTSDPNSYVIVTNVNRYDVFYARDDGGPTILVEELLPGYLTGNVDKTKISSTLSTGLVPVLQFEWMFEKGTVPTTATEAVDIILARLHHSQHTPQPAPQQPVQPVIPVVVDTTTAPPPPPPITTPPAPQQPVQPIIPVVVDTTTAPPPPPPPITTPPQQQPVQPIIPVVVDTTTAPEITSDSSSSDPSEADRDSSHNSTYTAPHIYRLNTNPEPQLSSPTTHPPPLTTQSRTFVPSLAIVTTSPPPVVAPATPPPVPIAAQVTPPPVPVAAPANNGGWNMWTSTPGTMFRQMFFGNFMNPFLSVTPQVSSITDFWKVRHPNQAPAVTPAPVAMPTVAPATTLAPRSVVQTTPYSVPAVTPAPVAMPTVPPATTLPPSAVVIETTLLPWSGQQNNFQTQSLSTEVSNFPSNVVETGLNPPPTPFLSHNVVSGQATPVGTHNVMTSNSPLPTTAPPASFVPQNAISSEIYTPQGVQTPQINEVVHSQNPVTSQQSTQTMQTSQTNDVISGNTQQASGSLQNDPAGASGSNQ